MFINWIYFVYIRSLGRNKNESVTKPARNRFGTPGRGKIAQEEVQETQQDEIQLKNKPYRKGW